MSMRSLECSTSTGTAIKLSLTAVSNPGSHELCPNAFIFIYFFKLYFVSFFISISMCLYWMYIYT